MRYRRPKDKLLKVKNSPNEFGLLAQRFYILPQYMVFLLSSFHPLVVLIRLIDASLVDAYLFYSQTRSFTDLFTTYKKENHSFVHGFNVMFNTSKSFLLDLCFLIFESYPKVKMFGSNWHTTRDRFCIGRSFLGASNNSIGERSFFTNKIKLVFSEKVPHKRVCVFEKVIKDMDNLNLSFDLIEESRFMLGTNTLGYNSFLNIGERLLKSIIT